MALQKVWQKLLFISYSHPSMLSYINKFLAMHKEADLKDKVLIGFGGSHVCYRLKDVMSLDYETIHYFSGCCWTHAPVGDPPEPLPLLHATTSNRVRSRCLQCIRRLSKEGDRLGMGVRHHCRIV